MFEYLCANGSLSACVKALKFGSWQSAALFCSVFRYCGIAASAQCSLKVKQLAPIYIVRWSNERYLAANTQHWNHTAELRVCVPSCSLLCWMKQQWEKHDSFWRYNLGKTVIKNAPIICPHFIQFHASWEGERSRFLLSPYILSGGAHLQDQQITRMLLPF